MDILYIVNCIFNLIEETNYVFCSFNKKIFFKHLENNSRANRFKRRGSQKSVFWGRLFSFLSTEGHKKKTLSHLGKGLEVKKQIYCIRLAFRKQQHLLTIRIPERQGKKHKAVSGD